MLYSSSMIDLSILPSVNASLNVTTAVLLILGYVMVRRRALMAHKTCMLAATVTSSVFLASYIYYHIHHGTTRFEGIGLIRPVYFTVLITHTILAVVQVPLILTTLYRAFRGQFEKHKLIARITLPMWLYVSVTGVVIYWMLYRMNY